MPNHPVPNEAKRRRGNPGKRKLPDEADVVALAPANTKLVGLDAGEVLARVLEDGAVWLAETDEPALVLLREALEDYHEARGVESPRIVMEYRKQIMSILAELGFTPTARARLGVAEVKAKSLLESMKDAPAGEVIEVEGW